jgi:hypothetical protein
MRAIALALVIAGLVVAPAEAGTWKYGLDQQEHRELSYVEEDGKATFFIGCGRAFALHVKYPGEVKTQGETSVTLTSGKNRMTFKGEFEEPADDLATTFYQYDLGYRRQVLELYRKKWKAQRDRLLDLLDSGKPLTISAGKASYTLPPVDAKEWRKAIGQCG